MRANNPKASLDLVPMLAHPRGPNDRPPADVATQRIFLARLFTLIGTMCECAGDFMADRFRNDVWSVMASHLGDALRRQVKDAPPSLQSPSRTLVTDQEPKPVNAPERDGLRLHQVSNECVSSGSTWTTSERLLVRSILQCLNQALGQEECGRALGAILVPIGSMLLPLLDNGSDPEIADLSMESVKKILNIDCDALLRPLLELSGAGIPPCPLKKPPCPGTKTSECKEIATTESHQEAPESEGSILANRCRELLEYLESLPEQSIP
jgi:hypothetical protein